jgi:ferredoxin-nitrite reductase
VAKHGHIGVFPQKQPGKVYVGVVLPVGRITVDQMRKVADLADAYGSGVVRLTVWQNLLISDVAEADVQAVTDALDAVGLPTTATNVRAGLVSCTGAMGCKYAAAHTKQHAMTVAEVLDKRVALDAPVNIHLTGCPNSCAQHYMGDIGMIGTKVEVGDDMVEGYHVFVGGGYGADQAIGREIYRDVLATDLPAAIEKMLRGYMAARKSPASRSTSSSDDTRRTSCWSCSPSTPWSPTVRRPRCRTACRPRLGTRPATRAGTKS